MKVATKQIQIIHALLSTIGPAMGLSMASAEMKEYKAGLVGEYSNWRVSSTTGLYYEEAAALITDLQKMASGDPALSMRKIKENDKRRLLLHYAHEMMWEIPGPQGLPKVDMARVNNWCIEYGYLHKPLMSYKLEELSTLVWQMEQAVKAFLKSV